MERIDRIEKTLGTLISWLTRDLGSEGVSALLEQLQPGDQRPAVKRVIFDFEFVSGNPCLPISVGLTDVDTGAELYLEWPQAEERASANAWLAENVKPHLDPQARRSEEEIERAIRAFLFEGTVELQLYASYGAYDFFLLSETLGGFLRSGLPYTYTDLAHLNLPRIVRQGERNHHALDDVRLLARAFRAKEQ